MCKNCSICSMTLRLRNPGFSVEDVESERGLIWANDTLENIREDITIFYNKGLLKRSDHTTVGKCTQGFLFYLVCAMMDSLKSGATGKAAWAVEARTDKYHMAVASITLTPLDFTTLTKKNKNNSHSYHKHKNSYSQSALSVTVTKCSRQIWKGYKKRYKHYPRS